jgi:hypothetical protein
MSVKHVNLPCLLTVPHMMVIHHKMMVPLAQWSVYHQGEM